mmetsp:Transcript_18574/g.31338  ORF Transcript_18574/g.31338 Transcript_18574/m.31338 type:complete len:272 (+) Transcript_18574:976-1791(+)
MDELPYNHHTFIGVFMHYALDWAMASLYLLIACALRSVHVRDRYFEANDESFQYPLQPDFISITQVGCMAVMIPVAVSIVLQYSLRKRAQDWNSMFDLHHCMLGLAQSLSVAWLALNSLKVSVGRIRPSGFARKDAGVDNWNMSYPSGHTGVIFCGMTFLSLYLSGKAGTFRTSGMFMYSASKDPFRGIFTVSLFTFILPLSLACMVLASRLVDYAHDFADVNAAAVIGILSATLGYHVCFPSLSDSNCHLPRPLAYLKHCQSELDLRSWG